MQRQPLRVFKSVSPVGSHSFLGAQTRGLFGLSYRPTPKKASVTYVSQCLVIVPQQVACLVERFGKFQRILTPGLHLVIPLVDRVAYTHSLKEEAIPVTDQNAITKDNVSTQS